MNDVSEGKIKGGFVGLKSKMYSIKDIDGKESNTAKGVHLATEFKELRHFVQQKNNDTQNEKNSKQKT